jgi:hypothetical protein
MRLVVKFAVVRLMLALPVLVDSAPRRVARVREARGVVEDEMKRPVRFPRPGGLMEPGQEAAGKARIVSA